MPRVGAGAVRARVTKAKATKSCCGFAITLSQDGEAMEVIILPKYFKVDDGISSNARYQRRGKIFEGLKKGDVLEGELWQGPKGYCLKNISKVSEQQESSWWTDLMRWVKPFLVILKGS